MTVSCLGKTILSPVTSPQEWRPGPCNRPANTLDTAPLGR
jgi:hypothetical protein